MWYQLKGVHKTTKTLADGTRKDYFYAWKAGPRIDEKPGSKAFREAYDAAHAETKTLAPGTIAWLIQEFTFVGDESEEGCEAWAELGPRTRADHLECFEIIKAEFASTTLKKAQEKGSRQKFKNWRASMKSTPRTADKRWSSLNKLFNWAVDQEHMGRNPCAKAGKLYHGNRSDKIWTPEQEAAFEAVAHKQLLRAKLLADDTGQREGDLLALPWSAYDGKRIRLTQSKSKRSNRPGKRVSILCTRRLKAELDLMKAENEARDIPSTHILVGLRGRPWTQSGFGASWRKASRRAGITKDDVTFHDLRGTFVVKLIRTGRTLEQIARVTGHSMDDLRTIEGVYAGFDEETADDTIVALNR